MKLVSALWQLGGGACGSSVGVGVGGSGGSGGGGAAAGRAADGYASANAVVMRVQRQSSAKTGSTRAPFLGRDWATPHKQETKGG